MPDANRAHHCPLVVALHEHLDELRDREKQLAQMVTKQKSARKTSISASLEARLRVVSLEIYDLTNLLGATTGSTP